MGKHEDCFGLKALAVVFSLALAGAGSAARAAGGGVGVSLKFSAGPSLLFNGGGDLETNRVETQAWLSAHPSPWTGTMTWEGLSTVPDWKAEAILTFGRHFGLGLGLGRTALVSRGDLSAEFHYYDMEWSAIQLDNSNSFSQRYSASALAFQLNFYYFLPLGRFEFHAFAGPGCYLGKLSHDYEERLFFSDSTIYFSPSATYTEEYQEHKLVSESASCTRLGFQAGIGVEFRVSPHISLGVESVIRRVNFDDWQGTYSSSYQSTDRFYSTSQGWWKTITDGGVAAGKGDLWSHAVKIFGDATGDLPMLSISEGAPQGSPDNVARKAEINFHAIDLLLTLTVRF